jgi:hypothetical protein
MVSVSFNPSQVGYKPSTTRMGLLRLMCFNPSQVGYKHTPVVLTIKLAFNPSQVGYKPISPSSLDKGGARGGVFQSPKCPIVKVHIQRLMAIIYIP